MLRIATVALALTGGITSGAAGRQDAASAMTSNLQQYGGTCARADDPPRPRHVALLDRPGVFSLALDHAGHQARVTITVKDLPDGWPGAMLTGTDGTEPSSAHRASPDHRLLVITDTVISVDGCAVLQPSPGIVGYTDPGGATLGRAGGRWTLALGGSDGAGSYGVTYQFDNHRVIARELSSVGLVEHADYRIRTDPDVMPYC